MKVPFVAMSPKISEVPKVNEAGITRFAQILVGNFMANEYELSKLYDKGFAHMYRDAK